MQRQKTIAKWLAIVLLLTLAVGAYIIYDALYIDAGGGANASDTPADDPSSDLVPPDPPYYTTLPRSNGTYAGVTVGHAGGEGADTVLGAVFSEGGELVFFSSDSDEYDCRGAGLYAAAFDSEGLVAVTRFAEGDATFGGAKQTADGIAALSSDDAGGKLTLFDFSGRVKGECSLPSFTAAFPLAGGDGLYVFFSTETHLGCAVVESGLIVRESPFRLPEGGHTVREAMAGAGSFTLVTEREAEVTAVISFSESKGFSVKREYADADFCQILPIAGEDGAAWVLMTKSAGGLRLSVFGPSLELEAETAIDGAGNAVMFGDGVSFTVVRTGVTETYCRHLDLVSSVPTGMTVGEVLFVRSDSSGKIFAHAEEGTMSVVRLDGSDAVTLMECVAPPAGKVGYALSGEKLLLAFSTSDAEGIFFENFGETDAYFVSMPV